MYASQGVAGQVTAIPNAASSAAVNIKGSQASNRGALPEGDHIVATALVILGLWMVWAVVQQRQRIKDQIQPSNIALNFHNLITFLLSALIIFGLWKIFLAKCIAWKIPGAKAVAAWSDFAI